MPTKKGQSSRKNAEQDDRLLMGNGWRIQHPGNARRWSRHDSMTNGFRSLDNFLEGND
jgi:hypothetical protein